MKRFWQLALGTLLAFTWLGAGSASAITMTVTGLGLDFGGACPTTASSCSAEWDFFVTPTEPVTGTFDYTAGAPGSMDIELDVADFSITGSGPDGVEEILFTNLHISISNWPTFEVGSEIQGLGFATATLTGSYEQLDGIGGTVVGSTPFNVNVQASTLSCLVLPSFVGQCGLLLTARDFQISVGDANATSYDVQFGINANVVPEPSTALLVGLGLVAVPALRRYRSQK